MDVRKDGATVLGNLLAGLVGVVAEVLGAHELVHDAGTLLVGRSLALPVTQRLHINVL